MIKYLNLNGDSNVEAYEIGSTYIDIKYYGTSRIYRYSYSSAGAAKVEKMKDLAQSGTGLSSYIMLNAKYEYE